MSDNSDDAGDLDDFMDSIGLDVKPASPEDNIMIRLTGQGAGSSKYKEIHNLRYQLIHDLYMYFHLMEDGVIFVRDNKALGKRVELSRIDYARSTIKYYLLMRYQPYFDPRPSSIQNNLGPADLDKVCDLVIAHEEVARVLAQDKESLPKLHFGR